MKSRKCKVKKICNNCLLFNKKESVCLVNVLINGEKYELPVNPNDECHWERIDKEIDKEVKTLSANNTYFKAKLMDEVDKPIEIKQIRVWSDGTNGYIESPE